MAPTTPPSSQRVALVTGGNSGIGLECSRRLAREGFHVIVASRNREVSAHAVALIRSDTGNARVEEMTLDLGSAGAVRQFVKEFEARELPLHALVCNAGIQLTRGPALSPEGVELTIAVNHLGHFLLTNLLLQRLLASAPARVLVVASGVHDPNLKTGMPKAQVPDMESLAANGGPMGAYNGRLAYVNSKLANLWFTYELIRRVRTAGLSTEDQPLSINAFEPGLVPGSGLARDYNPIARFLWNNLLPVLTYLHPAVNRPERSGNAMAELVLDPALTHESGKYFPSHTQFDAAKSSEESYDEAKARALWELSVQRTGLTPEESPLV